MIPTEKISFYRFIFSLTRTLAISTTTTQHLCSGTIWVNLASSNEELFCSWEIFRHNFCQEEETEAVCGKRARLQATCITII